MVHRRLTVILNGRNVAIGALGVIALGTIAACGPKPVLTPPPPPAPACSPISGQSGVSATLSPAAAASMAASAVREARTDAADEHTLVTVESTPTGPAVTTHPVSSAADAASVAAQAAAGNDLLAVDTDAPVAASVATNDPNSGSQWAFTNTSFGALVAGGDRNVESDAQRRGDRHRCRRHASGPVRSGARRHQPRVGCTHRRRRQRSRNPRGRDHRGDDRQRSRRAWRGSRA